MHGSILALVGTGATVVPQPAVENVLTKKSAEAMAAVFGVASAAMQTRRPEDGKLGHAGASWGPRRGSASGGGTAAATSATAAPPETTTTFTTTWGPRGGLGGWGTTTEITTRKRVRNADGSYTSESLMGIELRHHPEKGTVSIELSEAAVLLLYFSGIAVLISGISLGCCLWQRNQQKKKEEACECPCCSGLYRERHKLGTGGFGEAALVQRAGRPYVVKSIACRTVNQANQALLEAACLQRLRHPGVVRFDEVFLHRPERGGCSAVIVMEFCAGGDLNDRLECSRGEAPLTERQHISFLEQLVAALKHVHAAGILHRDMKSSNVLVTRSDKAVKLADFGLSTLGLSPRRLTTSPRRMSRCGTAMYMAPEVAYRKPYGAASDVYGLGCVLLELLLRHQLRERAPEETRDEYTQTMLDESRKHAWEASAICADLAWRLLDVSPKTRATLAEAAATIGAAAALVAAAAPPPESGRNRAASEPSATRGGDAHSSARKHPFARAASHKQKVAADSAAAEAAQARDVPAAAGAATVASSRTTQRPGRGAAAVTPVPAARLLRVIAVPVKRRRLLHAD